MPRDYEQRVIIRACLKTKKLNKDGTLRGIMSIFNTRKNEQSGQKPCVKPRAFIMRTNRGGKRKLLVLGGCGTPSYPRVPSAPREHEEIDEFSYILLFYFSYIIFKKKLFYLKYNTSCFKRLRFGGDFHRTFCFRLHNGEEQSVESRPLRI